MIEIEELMIGNYLNTPEGVCSVHFITMYEGKHTIAVLKPVMSFHSYFSKELCSGIEVNREWLTDLGFQITESRINPNDWYAVGYDFMILSNKTTGDVKSYIFGQNGFTIPITNIKYVHQLQNFIYSSSSKKVKVYDKAS